MSFTCRQCTKEYHLPYKVGNAHEGANRTLCSQACYLAWLESRLDRKQEQESGGLAGLVRLGLGKLTE